MGGGYAGLNVLSGWTLKKNILSYQQYHELVILKNKNNTFIFILLGNIHCIFCYLKPKGQKGSYLKRHVLNNMLTVKI